VVQSAHGTPPAPQATCRVPGWHSPAGEQQPSGQVWEVQGVQTPSTQRVYGGHGTHEAALRPQLARDWPGRQTPAASQQPAQGPAVQG
jgi:hypothetical protein